MPERDQTPKNLSGDDGPPTGSQQIPIVMPRHEQKLVSRNQADDTRAPSPERRAAVMVGDGAGFEHTAESCAQTAKAEVDVFQIRPEAFVEALQALEHIPPEQAGGGGGDGDRCTHGWRGFFAVPGPERANPSAYQIVRAVDRVSPRRIQNHPGSKTGFAGSRAQALEPAFVKLDVAVQDGNPLGGRRPPAAVRGARKSGVLAHRNHAAATLQGQLGSAVSGSVIHHNDFGECKCLPCNAVEKIPQKVGPVVYRDNCREQVTL